MNVPMTKLINDKKQRRSAATRRVLNYLFLLCLCILRSKLHLALPGSVPERANYDGQASPKESKEPRPSANNTPTHKPPPSKRGAGNPKKLLKEAGANINWLNKRREPKLMLVAARTTYDTPTKYSQPDLPNQWRSEKRKVSEKEKHEPQKVQVDPLSRGGKPVRRAAETGRWGPPHPERGAQAPLKRTNKLNNPLTRPTPKQPYPTAPCKPELNRHHLHAAPLPLPPQVPPAACAARDCGRLPALPATEPAALPKPPKAREPALRW